MKPRWGIILLLSLLVASCTRDAGVQPFEPVAPSGDVTTPDAQPTATDISITVEGVEAQSAQTEEAEPTEPLPASPTTEPTDTDVPEVPTETDLPLQEVTDTPTTAPTNTPRPSPTTPPSPTPADEDDMADVEATTDDTEATPADDEEDFTPGGSGLVPPDVVTNTPMPTSTPLPAPDGEGDEGDEDDMADTDAPEEADGVPTGDPCVYVVRAGDNAFRIAVNNNVTLDELVEANPSLSGSNPIIQPGQELIIPGCESDTADVVDAPPEDDAPTPPPSGFEVYTVTSGDTLLAIARRYNTTIDAIVEANDLANPNRLSIGQELLIPIEGGQ